jgi:glycerophosphoryl diester phosphodiesterase
MINLAGNITWHGALASRPVVSIALPVLTALFLLYLFLIFPSRRHHPDLDLMDGRYIAHRGLHDMSPPGGRATPENSLAAFCAAAEAGYMIENDIRITADGQVVVFHDDTLNRMCGVDGIPESMTLAQLKELRLAGSDQTIPTLQECLDAVGGRVPLLIEFKCTSLSDCHRLCEAAAPILDHYQGKYLVQSFIPLVLRWYRKNRPHVCRGQLAAGFYREKFYMRLLGTLLFNAMGRPDFISYDYRNARNISRRFCTALGAHPVCWTLHNQEELDESRQWFRTFIFEDYIPLDK